MKEFTINQNDAGQRLDKFTAKAVPLLPSSLVQKYIRIKRIKVNGKGAKRDHKLVIGDVVQMYVNDEFFDVTDDKYLYLKITDPALDIIYEDENIVLINKTAGIICHSDGGYDYSSVVSRLQAYLYNNGEWRPCDENSFTPALCNRIDRNTSGIVIAAKNAGSLRIINEKFKLQEIDRYYLTVVHGVPKRSVARLEGYLFKDSVKNRVFITKNSQPGARSVIMEYNTVASVDGLSLLVCRLITGRTHQIRAQLADIGHPILGDGKYGSGQLDKKYGESKQALCSFKIVFDFKTEAGILEYLNSQDFVLQNISFVRKYFPDTR